jgi:hypothetical protein
MPAATAARLPRRTSKISREANGRDHLVPRAVVSIPTTLAIAGTYLIFSEVSYTYTPSVGYVLKSAITLGDVAYTCPRQSTCVYYGPDTACTIY